MGCSGYGKLVLAAATLPPTAGRGAITNRSESIGDDTLRFSAGVNQWPAGRRHEDKRPV